MLCLYSELFLSNGLELSTDTHSSVHKFQSHCVKIKRNQILKGKCYMTVSLLFYKVQTHTKWEVSVLAWDEGWRVEGEGNLW